MPFISTRPGGFHPAYVRYVRQVLRAKGLGFHRGMGQDGTDTIDTTGPSDVAISPLPTDIPIDIQATPIIPLAPVTPTPAPTVPASSGSLASWLTALSSAATAGTNAFLRLQGPQQIGSTGVLYNPATGQYYNPATGQVVNPNTGNTAISSLSSLGPVLLLGGLGLGAVMLISSMGKR